MSPVMERLRGETADLHRQAEGAEFQQRMVAGRLSRDEYVEWLGQMLCVHAALEAPLERLCAADPRFVAVTPEQFQRPYLRQDLEALGADPGAARPLPAVRRWAERVAQEASREPLRLLGYHYVLEGSNNGNRFIARRLRPALGLEPGAGDRYLDPYGEGQRERWLEFKEAMTGVGFSDPEIDVLVAAARDMFAVIHELSVELVERAEKGELTAVS